MPTQTFFRLPEEKRKKILLAAIHEFSTETFDKVSINQIIKEANISRGSFYMYFEDIYDVALYLMQQMKQEVIGAMKERYQTPPNQLDEFFLMYHDVMYDFYNQETYRNMFKNIITFFQGRPEEEMKSLKGRFPVMEGFDRLLHLLDPKQFKDTSQEYISSVIELALVLFRNVMFKTFILNLDKQASHDLLQQNISILKLGYGGR